MRDANPTWIEAIDPIAVGAGCAAAVWGCGDDQKSGECRMRAVFFVMLGIGLLAEPAFAARTSPRGGAVAAAPAKAKATPAASAKSHGAAPAAAAAAKSRGTSRSVAGNVRPAAGKARSVAGKPAASRGHVAARGGRGPRFAAYRGGVSRASAAPLARSVGWSAGLPPAVGIQAGGCPSGTMATLARGHGDVVRCMPI